MLVADTDGTPKLTLIIKKEIMKKKGLPVEKATDTTAPTKKMVICDPKPILDKRKSSKTLSPGLHNTTKKKLAP